MSQIFGALNLNDSDRVFNATTGQRAIYDAAIDYVNRVNADLNAALSIFVDETTSDHQRRYKLPGSGYLQRRNSQGRYNSVRAAGSWDVAWPLEDLGTALSWNDVDRAYMTVAELDRHILTVTAQNVNTVRFELLKALFNSAEDTWKDPLWGDLKVEPLANGDAVTYPPILGADADATENHYLESGYLYTAISDTNDPYATIADELEEHFGAPTGGSSIAVFQPQVVNKYTKGLTSFVPVTSNGVNPGVATDQVTQIPPQLTRIGRVIGYMSDSGVWVCEWRYMPTSATPYLMGIHLDAPKPVVRRIDPADTGLGDGLQLVYEDEEMPFSKSDWRHRFGFGVGNRLNGVVMELAAGGSYTVPPAFA